MLGPELICGPGLAFTTFAVVSPVGSAPVGPLEPLTPLGVGGVAEGSGSFAKTLARSEARLVSPVKTPLSSSQASAALRRAWTAVTGEQPSEETVSLITAQWAHETGGGASMYNYNFGGIKGQSPSGQSVAQRTKEGFGATERKIVDRFRAYDTADEGAQDYVRLLAGRYGRAVEAAKAGDASGFVRGLKSGGYFTGDPAAYERSVTSLAARFRGTSATDAGAPSPIHAPDAPSAAFALASGRAAARPEPRRAAEGLLPGALLSFSSGAADFGSIDDMTAANSLSMADELARTALRIAMADGERRHSVDSDKPFTSRGLGT